MLYRGSDGSFRGLFTAFPRHVRLGTTAVVSRRDALKLAVNAARKGDNVLIAGKGHENYQEIKGVKHHFDDRVVLRSLFEEIL